MVDACASESRHHRVINMELSQERDASAIGNLFQQIINDMKVKNKIVRINLTKNAAYSRDIII